MLNVRQPACLLAFLPVANIGTSLQAAVGALRLAKLLGVFAPPSRFSSVISPKQHFAALRNVIASWHINCSQAEKA